MGVVPAQFGKNSANKSEWGIYPKVFVAPMVGKSIDPVTAGAVKLGKEVRELCIECRGEGVHCVWAPSEVQIPEDSGMEHPIITLLKPEAASACLLSSRGTQETRRSMLNCLQKKERSLARVDKLQRFEPLNMILGTL